MFMEFLCDFTHLKFARFKRLATSYRCWGVSLKQCCECGRTSRMCLDEVDTSSVKTFWHHTDLNQYPPFQENEDVAWIPCHTVLYFASMYLYVHSISDPRYKDSLQEIGQDLATAVPQWFHNVVHLISRVFAESAHSSEWQCDLPQQFERRLLESSKAWAWTSESSCIYNIDNVADIIQYRIISQCIISMYCIPKFRPTHFDSCIYPVFMLKGDTVPSLSKCW